MNTPHRVLIIDDERWLVESLREVLKQTGEFEILEALSGEQGLRIAETEFPDVIVLDLLMPGLSGLDLCRLLKGNPETQRIPIVVLTARQDINAAVEAFQSGVAGYLLKPFDPKRLPEQLRLVLAPEPEPVS